MDQTAREYLTRLYQRPVENCHRRIMQAAEMVLQGLRDQGLTRRLH